MTNIEKIAANLLSTEEFFLGKKTYKRTSFEEMRTNVISRARETLEALEAYTGGVLNAPMAWTARNSIAIKVGYGVKNEALWMFKNQYGDEIDTLRANGRTRDEQRLKAIGFFSSAIPELEAGGLDEAIKAKLASYQARAEAAKAKREAKAALSVKPQNPKSGPQLVRETEAA
jgi:hypothetical protein